MISGGAIPGLILLEAECGTHMTANHSLNFVNPDNSVHTNAGIGFLVHPQYLLPQSRYAGFNLFA